MQRIWMGPTFAVLAVLGGVEARLDAAADPMGVVVRLVNYVGAPERLLATAAAEADEIFSAAGVRVVWEDVVPSAAQEPSGRDDGLTIRLVNVTAGEGSPHRPLGVSAPGLDHAFVFYDRILDVAGENGILLGRVIAHELGHLLLPPGRHADHGIMRGEIDGSAWNRPRFTPEESRRLRTAILARNGHAHTIAER